MEGVTARVEAEDVVLAGLDTGGGSVGPLPSVAGPWTDVLGSVPFVVLSLCMCLGRGYAVLAVGGCYCCCCWCTALLLLLMVGGSRGGAFAGTGIGAGIGGRLPVCRGGAAAGRRPERRDLVEDLACVEAVFLVRWFRDERSNADGTVGFVSQSVSRPLITIDLTGVLDDTHPRTSEFSHPRSRQFSFVAPSTNGKKEPCDQLAHVPMAATASMRSLPRRHSTCSQGRPASQSKPCGVVSLVVMHHHPTTPAYRYS